MKGNSSAALIGSEKQKIDSQKKIVRAIQPCTHIVYFEMIESTASGRSRTNN